MLFPIIAVSLLISGISSTHQVRGPRLFVSSTRTHNGGVIHVDCTAPASATNPKFTVLLNGKEVSTSPTVDLVINKDTFVDDRAKIQCILKRKDSNGVENVITLVEDFPRLPPVSKYSAAMALFIPLLLIKLFCL